MKLKFPDDDFLRLWAQHEVTWTWPQYAEALNTDLGLTGDERVTASHVSVRVSRMRETWRRERGVVIRPRKTSHTAMFESWPPLPVKCRDQSLYRFLEYHSLFLQGGEAAIPPSRLEQGWRTMRRLLRESDQVIRYDPVKQRLYRGPRTARERELDPKHERFSESREAYLSRHPDG